MSMTPEQRRRFVDRALASNPQLQHAIGQSPEQKLADKLQGIDMAVGKRIAPEIQARGFVDDNIRGQCTSEYLDRITSTFSREERDGLLASFLSIALIDRLR